MLVENVSIRPLERGKVAVSWTSENEHARSWVFVNGNFTLGPFFGDTKERTIVISVPQTTVFIVEVHDFEDDTVPASVEIAPRVQPVIGWNHVEAARRYRVYHTIFDTGTIESLLAELPPMGERMEINSPIKLEGRSGRWHSFRIVAVDQFGNESTGDIIPHYATDLPKQPIVTVNESTLTINN